jgi:hypothetical protein
MKGPEIHKGSRVPYLARYNDFFDVAARNGELAVLKRMPTSISGTHMAMNWAAEQGYLPIVQWLHANRTVGCNTCAMDWAAGSGHIDVVKWLHLNRTEGCSKRAMNDAAENGHLEVVQFLHRYRSEGDVNHAISKARQFGHFLIADYLSDFVN